MDNLIPLFSSSISCGLFGISDDFVERRLIPESYLIDNSESTFFVRASGDSMEPEIFEKDVLVVDRSLSPSTGDIVAVFLNGSPLCKRINLSKNVVTLESANPLFSTIEITNEDDFIIFGVVIGSMRRFRGDR